MTIRDVLTAYLRRKSIPARLRDEAAQADEIRALVQALHRAAPTRTPSVEWADDFLCELEARERAPVWPSVADIERLARERRERTGAPARSTPARPSRSELFARRILAREPVGEFELWGREAVEAVERHGVPADLIRERRAMALAARAAIYGRDAAQQWQREQIARFRAAREAITASRAERTIVTRELIRWATGIEEESECPAA